MLQNWPADGPKIVPFILATGTSSVQWPWTTGERLALDKLFLQFRSRQLWYTYEGKPLVLVVGNQHPDVRPDASRIYWLEHANTYTTDALTGVDGFTVRKMWARHEFLDNATKTANPDYPSWWSYSEQCQRAQGGLVPFSCWASHTDTPTSTGTTVPKWGGKTFFSQFYTVSRYPTTKVVIISGWNGWINQRACSDGFTCAGSPFLPNGNAVFFDEYDAQHNSTFEPGGPEGDLYYKFLKSALHTLEPGAFTGDWGTFSFGLPGDIRFIAQLTPSGPFTPVVFRGSSLAAYWYINTAVDSQGSSEATIRRTPRWSSLVSEGTPTARCRTIQKLSTCRATTGITSRSTGDQSNDVWEYG